MIEEEQEKSARAEEKRGFLSSSKKEREVDN